MLEPYFEFILKFSKGLKKGLGVQARLWREKAFMAASALRGPWPGFGAILQAFRPAGRSSALEWRGPWLSRRHAAQAQGLSSMKRFCRHSKRAWQESLRGKPGPAIYAAFLKIFSRLVPQAGPGALERAAILLAKAEEQAHDQPKLFRRGLAADPPLAEAQALGRLEGQPGSPPGGICVQCHSAIMS
jgi:hypothetical protein